MDAEYKKFLESAPYGPEELARWESAKQSLRDNPPSSTGQLIKTGSPQAWELDPIPLVVGSQDWSILANAIAQRMLLIDLLLQDIYGPQRLVEQGVVPASLVFNAPSYIRAARVAKASPRPMLYLYAIQASRCASGQWLVHADRTQGPSGCGHAIENRLAISRIHSDSFQSMQVSRIADFFLKLRQTLQDGSASKDRITRTALLSPGVQSPTYFEDAYLARYLGYTLTHTADLTVRSGKVYLKTLGGLVRVDCILRRLADNHCDPLDIDPNNPDGVAGLAVAAREGNVFLANALGTGWCECPGVTAILPKLAPKILGEELLLQNSPMWWCGEEDSRKFVLANIHKLWIRDAFVRHSGNQIDGQALSDQERNRLAEQIRQKPWSFVAIEPPSLSLVPTWVDHRVAAWPAVYRFFASQHRGEVHVLPGGVARVAATPRELDESLTSGTMSKDVWVLSDGPVKPTTLLSGSKHSVELKRSAMDLPSRVADHLHWLGRFCERAEFFARHARYCTSQLTSERASDAIINSWLIVRSLSDSMEMDPQLGELQETSVESATAIMRRKVLEFLVDRSRPDGIANAIDGIVRNAQNIRDRLSFDSWQIISRLDYSVLFPWPNQRGSMGDALLILNQMIGLLSAFAGLTSESMTRGPGWVFLDLGRRIERAQCLLRLLDRLLARVQANPRPILESILDICDSSMTYRYRYLMSYEIGPVLDLLVADQTNPRGLAFQFMKIVNHLDELNVGDKTQLSEQRKKMSELRGSLRLFDSEAIGMTCVPGGQTPLQERSLLRIKLSEYAQALNELSEFITRRFLTHTQSRQLQDMVNQ